MRTKKQLANLRSPFSSTNQPKNHNNKKRGPYLTSLLKKFLEKKIKYEDPETQKIIKGRVKDAIVWRLILNATQGENQAIKEIFERIDGNIDIKSLIDQSQHTHYTVVWEKKDAENSDRLRTSEIPKGNT